MKTRIALMDGKKVLSEHELDVETVYVPTYKWHGLDDLIRQLKPGQGIKELENDRIIVARSL